MKAPPPQTGRGSPPGRYRSIRRPRDPPEPRVDPGRRRPGRGFAPPPGHHPSPTLQRGAEASGLASPGEGAMSRTEGGAERGAEGSLHQRKTESLSRLSLPEFSQLLSATAGALRRTPGILEAQRVWQGNTHLRSVPRNARCCLGGSN